MSTTWICPRCGEVAAENVTYEHTCTLCGVIVGRMMATIVLPTCEQCERYLTALEGIREILPRLSGTWKWKVRELIEEALGEEEKKV